MHVVLTPTYSGCPATAVIRQDVVSALHDAGFDQVELRTALAPAWTTDWITEAGRRKLSDNGIVPPSVVGGAQAASRSRALGALPAVRIARHEARQPVRLDGVPGDVSMHVVP